MLQVIIQKTQNLPQVINITNNAAAAKFQNNTIELFITIVPPMINSILFRLQRSS